MSYIGTKKIQSVYIGTNKVKSVYVGTNKVYSSETIEPYLTFTALEGGSTIGYTITGTIDCNIQTSTNGTIWTDWDGTAITLSNVMDKIHVRNTTNFLGESGSEYFNFNTNGRVKVSGDMLSMVNYLNSPRYFAFYALFKNCASIVSAKNLLVPSCELCLNSLFSACTNLIEAPKLPALSVGTYGGMFAGCTSLTTAPALPATTLNDNCYQSMFAGCTSLTTAPALPATNLKQYCYMAMFRYCTSLTTAPALPATTLKESCYGSMFEGCSSLVTMPKLPATTIPSKYCYKSMFEGCSSLYINDTYGYPTYKTLRVPTSGTFTSSLTFERMFRGCNGTRSSDNLVATAGQSKTYYTQNQPV